MTQTAALDRRRPNFYDRQLLPSARVGVGTSWPKRFTLFVIWGLVLALLVRYDVLFMQWRYQIFPDGPKGLLKQIFFGFRDFGQVLPIFVAMVIILRTDSRRWTIVTLILVAQILAGIGYNTSKLTVMRYRPFAAVEQVGELDQMQYHQSWLGFVPGHGDDKLMSFPSGHSAGAFAFAGILAWFYPRLARLFWILAAGCALSRYVDAVHWLSDCFVGATIGYFGAWLALRPSAWAVPFLIIRKRKRRSHAVGASHDSYPA